MTSDAFFRMTVEDVFYIRGRGTVVTGQVESGTLKLSDEINLSRPGVANRRVVVAGIEQFRKQMTEAQPTFTHVGH
jgi:elongation factor Tu